MEQDQRPCPKKSKTASTKSQKNSYKSIYKEGYVTEASYIVELLFEKRAEIFNSGKYPESFWNHPKYKGQFTGQIIQANKLLKKYSGVSIIQALKTTKGIIKLQDEKLIKAIELCEKNKKDSEFKQAEEAPKEVAKAFGSKRNILRDL